MQRFKLVTVDIQLMNGEQPHAANRLIISTFFTLRALVFFIILFYSTTTIKAQQNSIVVDTAYQKIIADRTAKIVNTLDIKDAEVYKKVHQQLIDQYVQLNAIQDDIKAAVIAIKAQQQEKQATDTAIKKAAEKKAIALKQLHQNFIAQLKASLTADQIEKVKDGMTYRVLPVTWTAYLDMIPRLTQEQKDKMYAWLLEARELAMDEGSSDAKHAVFGKYKGRINNYLSAAGYDMKKEGDDWAKRIQAAKEAKQTQNNL
jgi:Protein of unknown function (DUF3826)